VSLQRRAIFTETNGKKNRPTLFGNPFSGTESRTELFFFDGAPFSAGGYFRASQARVGIFAHVRPRGARKDEAHVKEENGNSDHEA
jgi:hypothetical protein